eukprot:Gregarina_sp_Pseudo_9__5437@NODE_679_length_2382_cov_576_732394_g642_i0_p2_GENE_NODE_679_length_2382_cov_576_732394_g642_i0NODE_679_length_2382_cov_576_732394_g642_i0_p2_ORF_typecomplete_len312_score20_28Integrin_beta/PF00362_18/4_7e15VWA/PF00092_28/0_0002_NODE_679_length_2382_cov_576_732394_g642_i01791114
MRRWELTVLFFVQIAIHSQCNANNLPPLLAARHARIQHESLDYRATRTQDNCVFPLDVVIAQDCTGSLADDWDNMQNVQIPKMVEALIIRHPGTRFAIMCFQDKPFYPFGSESDQCIFSHGGFTTEVADLQSLYDLRFFPYGGSDGPENQKAILAAVESPIYNYNELATPLVVVSTDAAPHFAEDGLNPGLPPFSGTYDDQNPQGQCINQYYPSPDQVKSVLHSHLTYLAAVVYDPKYMYGLVARSWKWFVEFIGESDEFLNLMSSTSDDFWDRLSEIIIHLENAECGMDTTTPVPASTCPPCPNDSCEGH